MTDNFSSIINHFQVTGQCTDARPYGTGHLHDTYRVGDYILQRINHFAFRDVPALMDNIVRVTRHIRTRLEQEGAGEAELSRCVLTVIPTQEGGSFYRDEGGQFWRMYRFIPHTRSYDLVHSPEMLFQASYKFGEFLRLLDDLPGPPLHDTIPDFHNGPKRFEDFKSAVSFDAFNRAKSASGDIDFVLTHASLFAEVPELLKRGEIPLRATHNDTKVNNVLLDEESGKGVCVIDLDTVMPGVSLYDFGDLVRTTLSIKAEDERELSGVYVDISRFRTILKGFLAGAGESLTDFEKKRLVFSAVLMTLLIGMRFLSDYLEGDPYFKIHRPGQNLDRARRQFKLVQSIIEHEGEMQQVLETV
jgi:hypothetical protein